MSVYVQGNPVWSGWHVITSAWATGAWVNGTTLTEGTPSYSAGIWTMNATPPAVKSNGTNEGRSLQLDQCPLGIQGGDVICYRFTSSTVSAATSWALGSGVADATPAGGQGLAALVAGISGSIEGSVATTAGENSTAGAAYNLLLGKIDLAPGRLLCASIVGRETATYTAHAARTGGGALTTYKPALFLLTQDALQAAGVLATKIEMGRIRVPGLYD